MQIHNSDNTIQGIIELFATDNSGKVDEFILHQQYFNTSRLEWFAGDGMEKILTGMLSIRMLSC